MKMKHNVCGKLTKAGAVILASALMTLPGAAAGCGRQNVPPKVCEGGECSDAICLEEILCDENITKAAEQLKDMISTSEKKPTCGDTAKPNDKESTKVEAKTETKGEGKQEEKPADKSCKGDDCAPAEGKTDAHGEKETCPAEKDSTCGKDAADGCKNNTCGSDLNALVEQITTCRNAGNCKITLDKENLPASLKEALNTLLNKGKTEKTETVTVGQKEEAPAKQENKTEAKEDTAVDKAVSDYEEEVVRLVNEIRRKNGLNELKLNTELSAVARLKSADMKAKGYFDHQSPTYGSPFDMMKKFGITYRSAGENIAMGYSSPQAVVDGWMNSPGHRANILKESFTEIGVGYYADGNYWTQMFIG